MDYTIEKGIPMPEPGHRPNKNKLFPLDEMEIGDSFLVEKRKIPHSGMRRLRPKRFTTRVEGDNVRIWRYE